MDGHSVKEFKRADGKARVSILRRDDGYYSFGLKEPRTYEYEGNTSSYWLGTYASGLYESREAAEKDAVAMYPWLMEQAPSKFSY
jgi:hypothetical protein